MSEPPSVLGRVTGEPDVERGPDVEWNVHVPGTWLAEGATIRLEPPPRLPCATCGGGGCDACGRSGALLLDAATEPFEVRLGSTGDSAQRIRLPHQGAASGREGVPAGHLYLVVKKAGQPSARVTRVETVMDSSDKEAERRALMKRSVVMAILLVLTFFGMLRLSGWM